MPGHAGVFGHRDRVNDAEEKQDGDAPEKEIAQNICDWFAEIETNAQ